MLKTAVILADAPHHFSVGHPLQKLAGLTLVERQIRTLAKIGILNVVVVSGFDSDAVKNHLQTCTWPIPVTCLENKNWQMEDIQSLWMLQNQFQDDILLLRVNNIFDKTLLQDLRDLPLSNNQGTMLVDQGVNLHAYRLPPSLLRTAKQFTSIAEWVTNLTLDLKLSIIDCQDKLYHHIDTPASLKEAEAKLLQSCRKSTDGFISRHVNRRISLFCTKHLMNTKMSANIMTLITSIIGFASGYFAWLATPMDFAIAGFLFNAASILDGVDGELARIRISDSKLGQWLDTLSDNGALLAFMLGTMLGLGHRPDLHIWPLLIPSAILGLVMLLIVMVFFLVSYTKSGSLVAIKEKLESVGKINPIVSFFIQLNFLIRRDFFATVVMFVAFLDKPHWVIWGLSISTHVAWIFLVVFLLFFRSHLRE